MKVSALVALALSFNSLAIPAFAEKPAKNLNVLFADQSTLLSAGISVVSTHQAIQNTALPVIELI